MRASATLAFSAIACALLAACAAPPVHEDPPPDPPAPTFDDIDGSFVIDAHGDGSRPVTFFVPSTYDGTVAMPLVLVLAGYGVTGAQFDSALGFRAFAEGNDLIYAFPEGRVDAGGSPFWSASDACCDFAHTGVDDSQFLADTVTGAKAKANVSVAYVIGHSNGGFMAQRLACDHADIFSAIVSVSGAAPSDCAPSKPVAVLEAHGTADTTISYTGGNVGSGMQAYPSAEQTVASWAARNGCAAGAVDDGTTLDLDASLPGAETSVKHYPDCAPGGAAELWTSQGGQHVPNGNAGYLSSLLGFLQR